MRSGKIYADNDWWIQQLIQDNNYQITSEGKVYRKGKRLGRHDKEGYREIYYKGKRLKEHRIIYAKFKGKLQSDLVIEHKNGFQDDNHPSNLLLVTQKVNIEYKLRREDRGNERKKKKAS